MTVRTVQLPSGEAIPALGQGTRNFCRDPSRRRQEIEALRTGLDLGMTLIDTSEMFIGTEDLIREAIAGRRDQCFLVDKVLGTHGTRRGVIDACETSLRRLVTDHIDLYLLHWRSVVPLLETVEAFERLQDDGKIRYWGVANFSLSDMTDLFEIADVAPQVDQVPYNLTDRGIEMNLRAWARRHEMPLMAYSPLDEGHLVRQPAVARVAERHGVTPAAIALAWVLRRPDVIATPKAADPEHVRQNVRALDITLTPDDLRDLDGVFEPRQRASEPRVSVAATGVARR